MEELYRGVKIGDEQMYIESEEDVIINELGPAISRDELYKTLKDLRDRKSMKMDDISAEVLKNLDNAMTEKLFNIITNCYEKRRIPNVFFTSKYIIIPKKRNVQNDCSNYRRISIILHGSKILQNVIKHSLKNKI